MGSKTVVFLAGILWCFQAVFAGAEEWSEEDFRTVEGLEVTRAIAPGLVRHPIMATMDDRGRLFVGESSGENLSKEELLEQTPHSVKLLTDTDGDGVFDKATTFADNMTFPQGGAWVYDSLFVMSPPGMWYLEDTDDDGVADVRKMLIDGFDFTGNAADVHGPFLHPNGRLYWCHGRKGHEVVDPGTGELVSKGKGARIWSSQINGQDVRVFAGGGMDNPVELDFTETGELIGSVNLFYGRPRGDTLVHWQHGGAYPRLDQEAVIAEFDRTGPLLREIHNFGHVAVSGMCRYRSGKLNPEWKDQYLVAHFNSNQITMTRLKPEGSTFGEAGTEIIFQLNRPNSHLTDVIEDRNGDLLVIDTGGWFRIGCPNSQVARPDVPGGIYRISRKGTDYVKPEFPTPEQWDSYDPIQVAELIDSPDEFIQERAIMEMAIRGHSSIPEIRAILEDENSSSSAKRNCIWALSRMRFSDSPDLIFRTLQDPDPTVQAAACNAIAVTRTWQHIAANEPNEMRYELERNKTISGGLAKLVRTGTPDVARCAAVALGTMLEVRAIGSLIGRAGREEGMDPALRHAITYALIEMGDWETVLETLRSGNPSQQRVALWALESMSTYHLEPLDIVLLLDGEDAELRKEVAEVAKRHPDWDAAVANQFFLYTDALSEQRIDQILNLAPAFAQSEPMASFFDYVFGHEDPEVLKLTEKILPELDQFTFQESWKPVFLEWLGDAERREMALDCLGRTSTDLFDEELAGIAGDESLSAMTRVKALQLLTGNSKNAKMGPEAFDLIGSILENERDPISRSKAIEALIGARLSRAQMESVIGLFAALDPVELKRVFQIFRRFPDREFAELMAGELTRAPGFGALNLDEVRGRFTGFDPEVRAPVEEAIKKARENRQARRNKLDSLVVDVVNGDPEKGRLHFESGKGACITCHQVGETGRAIGPDLSRLGGIRTPVDFFESILYPGESIARDFESYLVTLVDGSEKMGLIQKETTDEIFLTDLSGTVHKIERTGIETIARHEQSLMPPGLDQSMSREELLDLVSYLMTLGSQSL